LKIFEVLKILCPYTHSVLEEMETAESKRIEPKGPRQGICFTVIIDEIM